MPGLFITMEGPDGAGKTTVIEKLIPLLEQRTNVTITSTREPGGSRIAEDIRQIILDVQNVEMDVRTEAILYAAARRQHLTDRILPLVYQGVARGIGVEEVYRLNQFATAGKTPDVTLYLDVPAEIGLERIHLAKGNRQFDRLDQEGLQFHQMVRQGYLDIIPTDPERFIQIDATKTVDEVVQECLTALVDRYPEYFTNGER